tara:strand:+ start:232 stop:984 length:753 start_codon:yes stop_codon:yes gene_type:complete
MKKSTRNADARSKSTTKRPFKSAYAVEKHDENEKVAPSPPPVLNSSSANEEEEEEGEEEILEGFPQDEAKNEETTVCVVKAADDTKEDEKENELMEDTKENVMDNVLEEPLEIISREFCEKKVSATPAVDYALVNAQIETMISRTLEILNEGKRAKCSPLMESIFGSLDDYRFGSENLGWPGFETEERNFQELVKKRIDAFVERCQVDIEKENRQRGGTKKSSVSTITTKKKIKNVHRHPRAMKPWLVSA